jgi:hypothetical protein
VTGRLTNSSSLFTRSTGVFSRSVCSHPYSTSIRWDIRISRLIVSIKFAGIAIAASFSWPQQVGSRLG